MAWLLDTNILSEIRKPRPEPKVVIFVSGTPLDELYVSAVTLAELRQDERTVLVSHPPLEESGGLGT